MEPDSCPFETSVLNFCYCMTTTLSCAFFEAFQMVVGYRYDTDIWRIVRRGTGDILLLHSLRVLMRQSCALQPGTRVEYDYNIRCWSRDWVGPNRSAMIRPTISRNNTVYDIWDLDNVFNWVILRVLRTGNLRMYVPYYIDYWIWYSSIAHF
jgi:hypothetical protein